MNTLRENLTLSFERIQFFADAVFAIAITLLVIEIKVPHIAHESYSDAAVRHSLVEMLPKFAGFFFSFCIIGLMWIEHHRIFQYIGHYDLGLIARNLLFLLFVAFIPFPTGLFSEYFLSNTAFVMYVASFGLAAAAKALIWRYAMKKRDEIIVKEIDERTIREIWLRSWAVPIVCVVAIAASFVVGPFGGFAFPLIPLVASLLGRSARETAA
jgi:uncharacterized membrane protein